MNLSPFSSTIHQGGQETIDVIVTLILNETDTYKVTVRNPTPANEQVHICDVTLGTVGTNVMCGVNKFNVTYISNVSKEYVVFFLFFFVRFQINICGSIRQ